MIERRNSLPLASASRDDSPLLGSTSHLPDGRSLTTEVCRNSRAIILFGRHAIKSHGDEAISVLGEIEKNIPSERGLCILLENGFLPRGNSDQQSLNRFVKVAEAGRRVFKDTRPGALEAQVATGEIPSSFIYQYTDIISKATRLLPSRTFPVSELPSGLDGGVMSLLATHSRKFENRRTVRLCFETITPAGLVCDDLRLLARSQSEKFLACGDSSGFLFWETVQIFSERSSNTAREKNLVLQLRDLTKDPTSPLVFAHYGAAHEVGLSGELANPENRILGLRSAAITESFLEYFRFVYALRDFNDPGAVAAVAARLIEAAENRIGCESGKFSSFGVGDQLLRAHRVSVIARLLSRLSDGGRAMVERVISDSRGDKSNLDKLLIEFSVKELPGAGLQQ